MIRKIYLRLDLYAAIGRYVMEGRVILPLGTISDRLQP